MSSRIVWLLFYPCIFPLSLTWRIQKDCVDRHTDLRGKKLNNKVLNEELKILALTGNLVADTYRIKGKEIVIRQKGTKGGNG